MLEVAEPSHAAIGVEGSLQWAFQAQTRAPLSCSRGIFGKMKDVAYL